ncbi:MAG: MBL fold metallo-hydrolase, partial [Cyanobacteria bacterium J06632_3]
IWVDPLVAAGCDAYLGCISALPATVQNFAQHQPLFWDERVLPRVRRLQLNNSPQSGSPESVAAGSDAAVFIVHPATHPRAYCYADDARWTIFAPDLKDISLWQSQLDTRQYGFDWLAELDSLLSPLSSEIDTKDIDAKDLEADSSLRAVDVEHYMLTNHCDGVGTTQLIHNLRPQHVIFVHGGPQQLTNLASLDDLQSRYQLHLPTPEQMIELPLAEAFWQPAPPRENLYEGEIDSGPAGIQLRLPSSLEGDPRWLQLADTGIVEASWQGDQLVLRGVNQQELMQVGAGSRGVMASASEQTCYYCRHLRGQRCRNPDSPLVGLQVTSDGSCAVFERSGKG